MDAGFALSNGYITDERCDLDLLRYRDRSIAPALPVEVGDLRPLKRTDCRQLGRHYALPLGEVLQAAHRLVASPQDDGECPLAGIIVKQLTLHVSSPLGGCRVTRQPSSALESRSSASGTCSVPFGDKDALDVDELADAEMRQLASVPALLYTAERQLRIGPDHLVYEHRACLNLLEREVRSPLQVAREHATTQAEDGVVSSLDRARLALDRNDGGHRAEQLLVVGRHTDAHVGEHRWRVVGSRCIGNMAAAQAACAICDTVLYLLVQLISQVVAGHRANLHALVHRIAHARRLHLLDQQALKLGTHRVHHHEPLGGDAALPGVYEAALG